MDAGELQAMRQAAGRVLIDVGTGDARTAYRIARERPDWLVIGLDPAWRRMVPTAVRSRRKPAKGGVSNLVLVSAVIEEPPQELVGLADELLVLMPWGKLLRGVVLGEADVCGGLRAVAKAGATVDVTVGTSIWRDPVPLEIRDLPELTPEYARDVLSDRLAALGWRITAADLVSSTAMERINSSWARRLGSGSAEVVMHLRAVAVPPARE
ncbi:MULTISPECIES: rRNA methyltransferase [Thermomonospora]|nr:MULTISPECIES: rRNA methyltransferase [Thermomonospora]